uniref:G_PROTEIN_RECEP_F1_2 domain-containing protein n=1 Tax=Steinernema glaseri TaxID=37863 RepID=A0A1I8AJD1_9BILA
MADAVLLHFPQQVRKIVVLFVVCYVWTVISVLLHASRTFLTDALHLVSENFNFGPFMWVQVLIALLCYSLMIATYVRTVISLRSHRNVVSVKKTNASSEARWRTLKSILIYCTPPNIIAAAAIGQSNRRGIALYYC